MATPPSRLSAHHLAAARLFAAGWRRREIGETLRLHPSTLSHWLKAWAFRNAVRESRERLHEAFVRATVRNLLSRAFAARTPRRSAKRRQAARFGL
jgi:uncharacterized protein YjcR